uniref:(California timema) hypothetical protein n=1 Tax=Timema californicum TaxID=61474 RepID=A0A7R9J8P9_TIMCA|nr:unnamed protein product [Timema californicum]
MRVYRIQVLSLADVTMCLLYIKTRSDKQLEAEEDTVVASFRSLYLIEAFMSMFQFFTCLIFTYGSIVNKPRLFLPWLVVYTGSFLFYLGALCAAALSLQGEGEASTSVEIFLRGLISCVLNVYFLLLCFCILPRVDSPTAVNQDQQRSYYDDMLAAV